MAQILDDTVVTTGTLEEKEATLNSALRDIRAFADTARGFLDRNGGLIKEANQLTTTQLDLLARYAPEFPCVFKGLNNIAPRIASMFRGFELHIVLETLPQQPRAYNINDLPKFGDFTRTAVLQPAEPAVDPGEPVHQRAQLQRRCRRAHRQGHDAGRAGLRGPVGYRGTPEDVAMLRQLLRGTYGEGADSGLGVLLAGPARRRGG